jgi:hypothetical protein
MLVDTIQRSFLMSPRLSRSQGNKVWHQVLLHNIENSFPTDLYVIIRFYLLYRIFRVNYEKVITQPKETNFGVSQGTSALGSVLYQYSISTLSPQIYR